MTDSQLCTLVAKPHPFATDTVYAEVKAGMTIAQMLGAGATQTCSVSIDGHDVPQKLWSTVRPKRGRVIHIVIYPQGGGNGSKWIRLVALVVLTYFTYGATGWGASAASATGFGSATAWSAGIMLVGTLAINALVPPPSPKGLGGNGDPFNQLASLTGTSNQPNPYGVIPCVVGTMTDYFPPHAAMPYTEISGDDQYLRMMLDLGQGDDLDVSDIRIGETPITSFDDVEYEVTKTPTLFTQDIYEQQLAITLGESSEYTQTTQTDCSEISIDITFPQGLFGVNDKGDFVRAWQFVAIEFAVTGTSTWYGVTAPTAGITLSSDAVQESAQAQYKITSSANKALRVGVRWKVPPGQQWDVKLTTGTPGWDSSVQQSTSMIWTALRSVSPKNPSTTDTTKLCVRIKATDQLQGVVQNLKCRVAQRIPSYDPTTGTWGAAAESQNAARIYAWLLTRCPAVLRRLADSRVDLADLADWAAECDAKGLKTSFVMDSARAFGDWLSDVLASGRASFGQRNGKYTAIRDLPQTVPVQMFTPANSWGFSYSRQYDDLPHALRVKFTNPEAASQQDTRLVYADGYTKANATRFEELDLSMVVDPDAAWRLGRYHLSVIYNRPNQYSFQADIEHMVCERGDLVNVAHDIIGWGVAWGRIKAIDGDTITLDEKWTIEAGKSYVLRVRRQTGTQAVGNASTGGAGVTWDMDTITFDSDTIFFDQAPGEATTVRLTADLSGIAVGDLFVVGEVNHEVAPLIVRKIEPGDDLTATITCVDAAPAVWTSDAGTPPVFVSDITGKSWCAAPDAPVLTIRAGTTAVDNAGLAGNESGFSGGGGNAGLYRLPSYKQKQLGLIE